MPVAAEVILFLECPCEHSVNLRVFRGTLATPRILRTGKAVSSGPYRAGMKIEWGIEMAHDVIKYCIVL